MSTGRSLFQLGYELSPIILCDGIAASIPGGMLPIIAITQAANFNLAILNGSSPIDPNQFFAHFKTIPGTTLIKNEIGQYPFANQTVAANAMIAQPINVSVIMDTPANQSGAYVSKLVTFSALKAALDLHTSLGGTYNIATPAFIFTNCVLLSLRDVSDGQSKQVQTRWQWDFERPLITVAQATAAQSALMSKLSAQVPVTGTAWSSIQNSLGIPLSGASAVLTSAQNVTGTAVSNIAQSYSY